MPQAYENAGVSVEAGYEVVKRIKSHVARTNRPGVVSGVAPPAPPAPASSAASAASAACSTSRPSATRSPC